MNTNKFILPSNIPNSVLNVGPEKHKDDETRLFIPQFQKDRQHERTERKYVNETRDSLCRLAIINQESEEQSKVTMLQSNRGQESLLNSLHGSTPSLNINKDADKGVISKEIFEHLSEVNMPSLSSVRLVSSQQPPLPILTGKEGTDTNLFLLERTEQKMRGFIVANECEKRRFLMHFYAQHYFYVQECISRWHIENDSIKQLRILYDKITYEEDILLEHEMRREKLCEGTDKRERDGWVNNQWGVNEKNESDSESDEYEMAVPLQPHVGVRQDIYKSYRPYKVCPQATELHSEIENNQSARGIMFCSSAFAFQENTVSRTYSSDEVLTKGMQIKKEYDEETKWYTNARQQPWGEKTKHEELTYATLHKGNKSLSHVYDKSGTLGAPIIPQHRKGAIGEQYFTLLPNGGSYSSGDSGDEFSSSSTDYDQTPLQVEFITNHVKRHASQGFQPNYRASSSRSDFQETDEEDIEQPLQQSIIYAGAKRSIQGEKGTTEINTEIEQNYCISEEVLSEPADMDEVRERDLSTEPEEVLCKEAALVDEVASEPADMDEVRERDLGTEPEEVVCKEAALVDEAASEPADMDEVRERGLVTEPEEVVCKEAALVDEVASEPADMDEVRERDLGTEPEEVVCKEAALVDEVASEPADMDEVRERDLGTEPEEVVCKEAALVDEAASEPADMDEVRERDLSTEPEEVVCKEAALVDEAASEPADMDEVRERDLSTEPEEVVCKEAALVDEVASEPADMDEVRERDLSTEPEEVVCKEAALVDEAASEPADMDEVRERDLSTEPEEVLCKEAALVDEVASEPADMDEVRERDLGTEPEEVVCKEAALVDEAASEPADMDEVRERGLVTEPEEVVCKEAALVDEVASEPADMDEVRERDLGTEPEEVVCKEAALVDEVASEPADMDEVRERDLGTEPEEVVCKEAALVDEAASEPADMDEVRERDLSTEPEEVVCKEAALVDEAASEPADMDEVRERDLSTEPEEVVCKEAALVDEVASEPADMDEVRERDLSTEPEEVVCKEAALVDEVASEPADMDEVRERDLGTEPEEVVCKEAALVDEVASEPADMDEVRERDLSTEPEEVLCKEAALVDEVASEPADMDEVRERDLSTEPEEVLCKEAALVDEVASEPADMDEVRERDLSTEPEEVLCKEAALVDEVASEPADMDEVRERDLSTEPEEVVCKEAALVDEVASEPADMDEVRERDLVTEPEEVVCKEAALVDEAASEPADMDEVRERDLSTEPEEVVCKEAALVDEVASEPADMDEVRERDLSTEPEEVVCKEAALVDEAASEPADMDEVRERDLGTEPEEVVCKEAALVDEVASEPADMDEVRERDLVTEPEEVVCKEAALVDEVASEPADMDEVRERDLVTEPEEVVCKEAALVDEVASEPADMDEVRERDLGTEPEEVVCKEAALVDEVASEPADMDEVRERDLSTEPEEVVCKEAALVDEAASEPADMDEVRERDLGTEPEEVVCKEAALVDEVASEPADMDEVRERDLVTEPEEVVCKEAALVDEVASEPADMDEVRERDLVTEPEEVVCKEAALVDEAASEPADMDEVRERDLSTEPEEVVCKEAALVDEAASEPADMDEVRERDLSTEPEEVVCKEAALVDEVASEPADMDEVRERDLSSEPEEVVCKEAALVDEVASEPADMDEVRERDLVTEPEEVVCKEAALVDEAASEPADMDEVRERDLSTEPEEVVCKEAALVDEAASEPADMDEVRERDLSTEPEEVLCKEAALVDEAASEPADMDEVRERDLVTEPEEVVCKEAALVDEVASEPADMDEVRERDLSSEPEEVVCKEAALVDEAASEPADMDEVRERDLGTEPEEVVCKEAALVDEVASEPADMDEVRERDLGTEPEEVVCKEAALVDEVASEPADMDEVRERDLGTEPEEVVCKEAALVDEVASEPADMDEVRESEIATESVMLGAFRVRRKPRKLSRQLHVDVIPEEDEGEEECFDADTQLPGRSLSASVLGNDSYYQGLAVLRNTLMAESGESNNRVIRCLGRQMKERLIKLQEDERKAMGAKTRIEQRLHEQHPYLEGVPLAGFPLSVLGLAEDDEFTWLKEERALLEVSPVRNAEALAANEQCLIARSKELGANLARQEAVLRERMPYLAPLPPHVALRELSLGNNPDFVALLEKHLAVCEDPLRAAGAEAKQLEKAMCDLARRLAEDVEEARRRALIEMENLHAKYPFMPEEPAPGISIVEVGLLHDPVFCLLSRELEDLREDPVKNSGQIVFVENAVCVRVQELGTAKLRSTKESYNKYPFLARRVDGVLLSDLCLAEDGVFQGLLRRREALLADPHRNREVILEVEHQLRGRACVMAAEKKFLDAFRADEDGAVLARNPFLETNEIMSVPLRFINFMDDSSFSDYYRKRLLALGEEVIDWEKVGACDAFLRRRACDIVATQLKRSAGMITSLRQRGLSESAALSLPPDLLLDLDFLEDVLRCVDSANTLNEQLHSVGRTVMATEHVIATELGELRARYPMCVRDVNPAVAFDDVFQRLETERQSLLEKYTKMELIKSIERAERKRGVELLVDERHVEAAAEACLPSRDKRIGEMTEEELKTRWRYLFLSRRLYRRAVTFLGIKEDCDLGQSLLQQEKRMSKLLSFSIFSQTEPTNVLIGIAETNPSLSHSVRGKRASCDLSGTTSDLWPPSRSDTSEDSMTLGKGKQIQLPLCPPHSLSRGDIVAVDLSPDSVGRPTSEDVTTSLVGADGTVSMNEVLAAAVTPEESTSQTSLEGQNIERKRKILVLKRRFRMRYRTKNLVSKLEITAVPDETAGEVVEHVTEDLCGMPTSYIGSPSSQQGQEKLHLTEEVKPSLDRILEEDHDNLQTPTPAAVSHQRDMSRTDDAWGIQLHCESSIGGRLLASETNLQRMEATPEADLGTHQRDELEVFREKPNSQSVKDTSQSFLGGTLVCQKVNDINVHNLSRTLPSVKRILPLQGTKAMESVARGATRCGTARRPEGNKQFLRKKEKITNDIQSFSSSFQMENGQNKTLEVMRNGFSVAGRGLADSTLRRSGPEIDRFDQQTRVTESQRCGFAEVVNKKEIYSARNDADLGTMENAEYRRSSFELNEIVPINRREAQELERERRFISTTLTRVQQLLSRSLTVEEVESDLEAMTLVFKHDDISQAFAMRRVSIADAYLKEILAQLVERVVTMSKEPPPPGSSARAEAARQQRRQELARRAQALGEVEVEDSDVDTFLVNNPRCVPQPWAHLSDEELVLNKELLALLDNCGKKNGGDVVTYLCEWSERKELENENLFKEFPFLPPLPHGVPLTEVQFLEDENFKKHLVNHHKQEWDEKIQRQLRDIVDRLAKQRATRRTCENTQLQSLVQRVRAVWCGIVVGKGHKLPADVHASAEEVTKQSKFRDERLRTQFILRCRQNSVDLIRRLMVRIKKEQTADIPLSIEDIETFRLFFDGVDPCNLGLLNYDEFVNFAMVTICDVFKVEQEEVNRLLFPNTSMDRLPNVVDFSDFTGFYKAVALREVKKQSKRFLSVSTPPVARGHLVSSIPRAPPAPTRVQRATISATQQRTGTLSNISSRRLAQSMTVPSLTQTIMPRGLSTTHNTVIPRL